MYYYGQTSFWVLGVSKQNDRNFCPSGSYILVDSILLAVDSFHLNVQRRPFFSASRFINRAPYQTFFTWIIHKHFKLNMSHIEVYNGSPQIAFPLPFLPLACVPSTKHPSHKPLHDRNLEVIFLFPSFLNSQVCTFWSYVFLICSSPVTVFYPFCQCSSSGSPYFGDIMIVALYLASQLLISQFFNEFFKFLLMYSCQHAD